jgi:rfaE bifunctional protein nucleotidyltransferase chain/domain/rfaE bifunctional protein kinase chain/domain
VVVVGDVLLDVDVLATADRLTPDGPAPVLDERDRIERGGGAALAATLAAATAEAPVRLVAPIPDDEAGRRVREVLDPAIEVIALPCTGATPVKTRLRAGGVTVARLDRAGGSTVGIDAVPPEAAAAIRSAGAVLVSDYGGGTTADQRVRELLTEAAAHLPVVWDPHPRGTAPVPGATLVTPNSAEAGRLSGRPGEDVAAAREQADELRAQWQARAVVVTLGSRGALLSFGTGAATVVPTPVQVPGDTCGAGDSFAAAAAAALARGALPSEAVAAAVSAATDFVAGGGVARPTADRAGPASADVDALLAAVRARGGTVVATGGCFDLLHAGHVATLEAARALGDCLVVCLNSDDSVRRLKGDGRPLQPAQDRARVLAALDAVDAVVVFDEDTPVDVLRRLRPDLWVKGGDYAAAELPETELLRSWGGEVVTVPYLPGRSTSGLVELSRR